MDLSAIAKSAAGIGFSIAGTAKIAATVHIQTSQTYDFATDKATGGGGDVPVVGLKYNERQARGADTSNRESAFLVEAKDAPSGIETADSLTIGSVKWNVFQVEPVAGAAYILRIRR
jgi:hypothetical protein